MALITGGASGLGRAATRILAERGASIVVADRDEAGGAETVAECEALGGEARYVRTDVTVEDDVAAAVAAAVDGWGHLDVAINNAGINGPTKPVAEYTLEEWNQVMAVNLNGIFLGLRHEIPQMVAQGGGAIVNTSSGAGLVGFADAARPTSRASTRCSGSPRPLRSRTCSRVCASTPCAPAARAPRCSRASWPRAPGIEEAMAQSAPIGRLARPEEIAEAMVWLLLGRGLVRRRPRVLRRRRRCDYLSARHPSGARVLASERTPAGRVSRPAVSERVKLASKSIGSSAGGTPSDSDGSRLLMWPMRPR